MSSFQSGLVIVISFVTVHAVRADQPRRADRLYQAVIAPHDTVAHSVIVAADVPRTIRIRGDGGSDLDAFVFDEFGRLLASDTGITDEWEFTLAPTRAGVIRVEVRNAGGRENAYIVEVI